MDYLKQPLVACPRLGVPRSCIVSKRYFIQFFCTNETNYFIEHVLSLMERCKSQDFQWPNIWNKDFESGALKSCSDYIDVYEGALCLAWHCIYRIMSEIPCQLLLENYYNADMAVTFHSYLEINLKSILENLMPSRYIEKTLNIEFEWAFLNATYNLSGLHINDADNDRANEV